jgi:hypothetical protein
MTTTNGAVNSTEGFSSWTLARLPWPQFLPRMFTTRHVTWHFLHQSSERARDNAFCAPIRTMPILLALNILSVISCHATSCAPQEKSLQGQRRLVNSSNEIPLRYLGMPVSLRHAHDTSASATAEGIPARLVARKPKSFRPPWAAVLMSAAPCPITAGRLRSSVHPLHRCCSPRL